MNDKRKKAVNKLYMCHRYDSEGLWRIKHNENSPVEIVTDEEVNNVIKSIRNIVGKESHKFHLIPAKAIMNELENVSESFKEEQEKWREDNPNLRNTGNYTPSYHNPLHVMKDEGWIEYLKCGEIDILDEKKILNAKLIKIVRKRIPSLNTWLE